MIYRIYIDQILTDLILNLISEFSLRFLSLELLNIEVFQRSGESATLAWLSLWTRRSLRLAEAAGK